MKNTLTRWTLLGIFAAGTFLLIASPNVESFAEEDSSTQNITEEEILFQSGSRYQPSYNTRPSSGARPGSGNNMGSGTQYPLMPVEKTYEQKLWEWLVRAQYKNWGPAPGQAEGTYPGKSPHGAFLKMYLNRTALGDSKGLPHGSVIIKENYGQDAKTLAAITVMYRAKGYNPKNFDWYWVKYNADGSVARTPADKGNMKIAGKFTGCIDCHAGAAGNDYAFFND